MQTVTGAGVSADEFAAAQRVQQIRALVEQAGAAATPMAGDSSANFATTLRAASAAGAAGGQYAAGLEGLQVGQNACQPAGAVGSNQYDGLIGQAAARYGLDPAVLHGLIQQESGFDPNSTSSAGAVGLTQLMPSTAASLGVTNPLDPAQSIEGGARYLSQMMAQFANNTSEALAAYNAGPGAVHSYGGVPPYPETQSYVAKVLANAEAYRQSPSASMTPGGLA